MTEFKHSPLHSPTDQIRLLGLQPGQRGELLEFFIHVEQLSHLPPYEALSYTWGTEYASCHVKINGFHFAVRPNLFDCLNELRLPSAVRTLWIDAICIDQTNTHERNHQVGEMCRIYSRATKVRIWIGSPSSWTKELFEYMNASESERGLLKWPAFSTSIGVAVGEDRSTPLVEGLNDVCARGYWGRAWILQELLLSGRKIVHCGPYSAPLDHIQDALKSARVTLKMERHPLGIPKSEHTLEELIALYGEAACGDVRDRIYALLGLATDCTTDRQFHIDYAEDACLLLCRTIDFCKPRNLHGFANRLMQILRVDIICVRQCVQSHTLTSTINNVKVELPAFYYGPASEIAFVQPKGNQTCLRWTCVRHERVLKTLVARNMLGSSVRPQTGCHEIKVFQFDGSPIALLSASESEEEELTFIPVVVEQLDERYKHQIILHRSSTILYNVTIRSGVNVFRKSIFVQPESLVWLVTESVKWAHISQPWARQDVGETVEDSM
jgi:hypothetical protein